MQPLVDTTYIELLTELLLTELLNRLQINEYAPL
jgi:hypothetical protein